MRAAEGFTPNGPTHQAPCQRDRECDQTSRLALAWPALLAQAQANRDTARAMMQAMQRPCGHFACALHSDVLPCGHVDAQESDELHCWYNDALEVADVALQATKVVELDAAINAWQKVDEVAVAAPFDVLVNVGIAVGVGDVAGTPPTTPRSRRSVDAGAEGNGPAVELCDMHTHASHSAKPHAPTPTQNHTT